jgi:hypothetical protein
MCPNPKDYNINVYTNMDGPKRQPKTKQNKTKSFLDSTG